MTEQYSSTRLALSIWFFTNLVLAVGFMCKHIFLGFIVGIASSVISFPVLFLLAMALPAIKKSSLDNKVSMLLLTCLCISFCYAYFITSNLGISPIDLWGLGHVQSDMLILFCCSLAAVLILLKPIKAYLYDDQLSASDNTIHQDFKTQTNNNMETTTNQQFPEWNNKPTNVNTNKVLIKAIIVAVLTLAMLVPTTLISNMAIERQANYQQQVRTSLFVNTLPQTMASKNYEQTMRTSKYAILVIGLTFTVFFLIELMHKRPVHPIQYVLVGLALAIFYTLLLSISEYMLFDYAYLIAATATISLIVMYVKSHFQSWKASGYLGAVLAGLYGFIFILVGLEHTALIVGSIGLFIALAIVMYSTRNINWYNPSLSKEAAV